MAVVAVNPKPEIKISTQIIVGTARISPAKPRTILHTHGCERFRAAISPSRNPIHAPIIVVTKARAIVLIRLVNTSIAVFCVTAVKSRKLLRYVAISCGRT